MSKLDKSVVLYFTPDEIGDPEGAHCNICRHWVDPSKCTEVTGKINGLKGICGLYAFGSHEGPDKEPDINPKSASYAETGPTHCGNCKFYGGGEEVEGPCQIVVGTVEFEGCCNAWAPGTTEKQMRENIRPKDEAGEGIKKPMKKEAPEGNEKKLIVVLEDAIADEKEAIDFYNKKLIPILDEPEEVTAVKGIVTEQEHHVEILEQIKEEEEEEVTEKAKGKRRVDDPLNIEDQSGSGSGVEKKKRKPGEPVNTEGEAGTEYSLEKNYDPEKRHKDATLGDMVEIAHARLPRIFRQAAEKYLGVDYQDIKIAKQGNPPYRSNLVRFAIQNAFSPDEIEREANYETWGNEEAIPVERVSVDTGTEKFNGLANGYLFLQLEDGTKAILGMWQGFAGGSDLQIFAADKEVSAAIINELNLYIRDNNYLRGKKLLSNGQFLNIGKTSWDDVVLSEEMQHTLQTHVLGYIANIEELKKLGLPTKRGLLIVGPPGNGKTMIGKALAWNSPSTFIWVPSSSDYRNVFVMARELAPSIVFIEDIAAHGGLDRRAGPVDSDTAELLNMLDGVEQNDLILTVATENNVDLLDPALRNRPGRFDVIVPLPNPSVDLRDRILRHYLPETPQDLITYAANQTSGYSGAHLRELATRMILEKATKDNIQEIIDGISDTFGAINSFEQDSEKELNEANVAGVFRERTIGGDKSRRYGSKLRKFPKGLNPPSDPGDPTGKAINDPIKVIDVLRDRGKHPELPKRRKKEPPHTTNPASSPPAVTVNIGSGVANLSEEHDPYNDLQSSE